MVDNIKPGASRLNEALTQAQQTVVRERQAAESSGAVQGRANAGAEAVKLAEDFGSQSTRSAEDLARIKQSVDDGSYLRNLNTRQVAKSVGDQLGMLTPADVA